MQDLGLLIDGRLVAGASTMPVINPASEEVIAQCPRADSNQLNQAVAAAKAAFPAWAKLGYPERRKALLAFADAVESSAAELARLLTAEQGKPLHMAEGEIAGTVRYIRETSKLDLPEKVIAETDAIKAIEHRTPLGVVAAIAPWNFPVIAIVVKFVPALLAGNTAVAKPAATTPLTALFLAKLANDVFPAGVLNVITDLNDLGGELTSHPDVAKVTFTGSTATGKKVLASAASMIKRVTLELGGNDVAIVLDDADPKVAANQVFKAAMFNSGQLCLAAKRAYVHESHYDQFCDEIAALADAAIVGDGTKQGTQYGPIQNKMQFEKVKGYIETGRRDGTIIAGGTTEGPGYFVRPTIVRDIGDDSPLVREEQFGPVLPVLKYSDLDDVLERANDTDFGLGGTIWTSNVERGVEIAKQIDSGMLWVNLHMTTIPNVTHGGAKMSGLGTEAGLEGLEEFTQHHVIYAPKT